MNLNIKYNSPVVLTFAIISFVMYFTNNILLGTFNPILTLNPYFNYHSTTDYISLFTYSIGHANTQHLLGNLSLMLIIGPIIEEKYGSKQLLIMFIITAISTAILNILLFDSGLMGASGIVFMLIILASFTNTNGNGIPLTFVLVTVFYLGNEIMSIYENDNISRFAHIAGGIIGSFFGFIMKTKTVN